MVSWPVIRVCAHVVAAVVVCVGVVMVADAVLTTSWQVYDEPGTNERHQHGLWLDWTLAETHVAGAQGQRWTFKYKFGDAVVGDEAHRAKAYQVNTLIMLCVGVVICVAGLVLTCRACLSSTMAAILAVLAYAGASVLSIMALLLFYLACTEPARRYITTDRRIELEIGNSFWIGVTGAGLYGAGAVLAVIAALITRVSMRKRTPPHTPQRGMVMVQQQQHKQQQQPPPVIIHQEHHQNTPV